MSPRKSFLEIKTTISNHFGSNRCLLGLIPDVYFTFWWSMGKIIPGAQYHKWPPVEHV